MPHGPFIRKKGRDILRPAAINELQAALENAPTLAEAGGGGGALDVRNYGAIGDNTTDDRAAIQSAENAAAALAVSTGSQVELLFPKGIYPTTGSITKAAKVHWRGPGRIRRRDNAAPTGAAFALVVANGVDDWGIAEVGLENLSLKTMETAGVTRSQVVGGENSGIEIFNCANFTIDRCRIERFSYGIRVQGSRSYRISDNIFHARHNPALTDQDYIDEMVANTYEASFPNATSSGTGAITTQYASTGAPAPCRDYVISGNIINAFGLNTGIEALSQSYDQHPGVITDNIIVGCRAGIQSYRGSYTDPGTASTWDARVVIANNRISWAWEQGIYFRSSYGYLVDANLMQNIGLRGTAGAGSSVGGIVTRADPASPSFSSPLNNASPTLITNNMLIDIGSTLDMKLDGGIQVRSENTIVRGNTITRSVLPSFITGTADVAIKIGVGESINSFTVEDNIISGHHTGINFEGIVTRSRRDHIKFSMWSISQNTIDTCPDYGIFVSANMIGGRISRNMIRASGTFAARAGLSIRATPFCEVSGNSVTGAISGILLANGNMASSIPYILSKGVIAQDRRRGGTIVCRNNILTHCATAHNISETSVTDVSFYGRCSVWEGDMVNGFPARSTYTAAPATTNNGHTWNPGDIAPKTTPTAATSPAWMCLVGGTGGDATYSTGDTTSGSPVVTAMSSLDGYGPGIYVTMTGFTGSRKIIDVNVVSSTITLDANAASSNVGATVTVSTPTFAAMAVLA